MISSDVLRGYNDTMILYLLLEAPSYGYELAKKIRETSEGKYIMKETTLYSVFSRLEKNGYVTSFYGDETSGKRRTYYRITAEGKAFYEEKCREWELTKEVIERFIERSSENGNH
ncbi:PadR family transcriptional regulator [Proteiniclasticum sp. C24MP]|uniref:PadR family transcriptional regulator n=1 Tax=Proteiniclasticum sp. C24MP TaxID=3374101 RepID=UPI003754C6D4